MKLVKAVFLVVGFLLLFMAGASGMIIAGVGPGSLERAIAALASAIAGCGLTITGAMLARS